MEAILPGSSQDLQRFTSTGSLRRNPPLSPPPILDTESYRQENPYTLRSPELSDSLTSIGSLNSPQTRPPPQNYLDPSPTGRGWDNQVGSASDHSCISSSRYSSYPETACNFPGPQPGSSSVGSGDHPILPGRWVDPIGSASDSSGVSSHSGSSKSKTSHSTKVQPAVRTTELETSNTRHESHRQTFAHGPREHGGPQLSRSKTERTLVKSPVDLYEMDQGMEDMQEQMKPPPPERSPPHTKPQKRRPLPQPGGNSQSPSNASSKHSIDAFSPSEDVESRYERLDVSSSFEKEPEYDVPLPNSMEKTAQMKGGAGNMSPQPKPRLSQSLCSSIRPVAKPRKKKPPPIQHEYLDLMPEDYSEGDSSVFFGLKQEIVQNLSADQQGMLKNMLQQASDQQCPPLSSTLSSSLPAGASVTTMQQNGRGRQRYNHSSIREFSE